ncbi:MAG: hypothetical protein R2788_17790 [Saprospiraceae bacterium]
MMGDIDEAVELGSHALFSHGLGHMIGLDVHDMEDLGERPVGYSDSVKRSKLFSTYLRLGRDLEPGFCVLTVESQAFIYPRTGLVEAEEFTDFINYEALEGGTPSAVSASRTM